MREKDVKQFIGEENWSAFCRWMYGQTVSVYEDGETDYYDWDVRAFKRKLDTGYDRQQDPLAWD